MASPRQLISFAELRAWECRDICTQRFKGLTRREMHPLFFFPSFVCAFSNLSQFDLEKHHELIGRHTRQSMQNCTGETQPGGAVREQFTKDFLFFFS
jgi:hypothetical protein